VWLSSGRSVGAKVQAAGVGKAGVRRGHPGSLV
jgi:hypothetical protein